MQHSAAMDLRPQTQTSIALAAYVFTSLGLAVPLFTAVPAMCRTDTVGRRSPLPNIAALLTCCLGILLGCARDDHLAIGFSIAGAIMQAIYMVFFVWYSTAWRLVLLQRGVPGLAYVLILSLYLAGAADTETLNSVGGCCGCLVPATIFYNVAKVMKHKSMECMPHPFVPSLALVSAPLSILYACAGKEPKLSILIPNCVGLASAVLQIFLHSCFWYQGQLRSDVEAALRECLLE